MPAPLDFVLPVSNASIGLASYTGGTGVIPDGYRRVFVTCRTAKVDWKANSAATASDPANHTLDVDERMVYGEKDGENIRSIRFIRSGSTDAVVVGTFY
jgi:hypothetical protein